MFNKTNYIIPCDDCFLPSSSVTRISAAVGVTSGRSRVSKETALDTGEGAVGAAFYYNEM
jgi:hypothetical protein